MKLLGAFLLDIGGATSIEYGMIGVGISILCIVGATSIGNSLSTNFLEPLAAAFN